MNGVVRGGMYGYKVYMDRCGFRYKDATLRGQGGFRCVNGALRSYAYDRASLLMRSGNRRSYALSGVGTGGALGFRI